MDLKEFLPPLILSRPPQRIRDYPRIESENGPYLIGVPRHLRAKDARSILGMVRAHERDERRARQIGEMVDKLMARR